MKKIAMLSLVLVPAILLASAGESEGSRYLAQTGRESDYWPRVVNFTIFAALLYYLIANPIKSFFRERREGIATQLKQIETMLQEAKEKKKEAQLRLEESEKRAEEIIADAKKEATLLAQKIAEANASELSVLEKQFADKMKAEERKATREVVESVLGENITGDDIALDEKKVVDIIAKKVA